MDFQILNELIFEYHGRPFILNGDFNSRISNSQVIPEYLTSGLSNFEVNRQSKDSELNSNRRELLAFLADFNFVILNGRTKGEAQGEFTYSGARGSSVIDYCAVSLSCSLMFHV